MQPVYKFKKVFIYPKSLGFCLYNFLKNNPVVYEFIQGDSLIK